LADSDSLKLSFSRSPRSLKNAEALISPRTRPSTVDSDLPDFNRKTLFDNLSPRGTNPEPPTYPPPTLPANITPTNSPIPSRIETFINTVEKTLTPRRELKRLGTVKKGINTEIVDSVDENNTKRNDEESPREHKANLRELTEFKMEEFQQYLNEITKCTDIVGSSVFRDFIDLTHNPSGFFMSRNSDLRCSFQVQKEKDLYCVAYGGQIYVFHNMTAKSCLYSIDLECADIDLAQKQESGLTAFEIGEDRGKKIYTFKSRVEHHAYEWILHCRKARTGDTNTNLLSYSQVSKLSQNNKRSTETILDNDEEHPNRSFKPLTISNPTKESVKNKILYFESLDGSTAKPVDDLSPIKDTDINIKYTEDGTILVVTK